MSKARLSISSWSLNRILGKPSFYGVEHGLNIPTESHNKGELSLIDLPKAISDFGIQTIEITHFHLPSVDLNYLNDLKQALDDSGVELFSLLIDDGDITHPEFAERDLEWISYWLDVAAQLGSKSVRVIAGKQELTPETLKLSIKNLGVLAEKVDDLDLRLMTENWFSITSTPESVSQLFDALDGKLGLCLDFGNWQGSTKYADFEQIAHYAESCHSKAKFEQGQLDREDYTRCLDILAAAKFDGPHTLIFDDAKPVSEWEGLRIQKKVVNSYL